MGKLIVLVTAFVGALFLMHSCLPQTSTEVAGSFGGYSITWAMLAGFIVVGLVWKMKGR